MSGLKRLISEIHRGSLWQALFNLLVVVSLGGLHACSREVDPFAANDRDENIGNSPDQLTFSSFNDRTPVWTLGGEPMFLSRSFAASVTFGRSLRVRYADRNGWAHT